MVLDLLPEAVLRIPAIDRRWMQSWFRSPPPESAHNGVGDFFDVGRGFVADFRRYCNLAPNAQVLDVGCGSGRVALGLARYLNHQGRYAGFDVRREAIEWCNANIGRRYPRFEFRLIDVLNHAYSPQGHKPAAAFEFPYPAASFDFAILTSVFTHMQPDDVRRYLTELKRVLRPGGRAFITWFILNDETRRLTAEHRSTLGFHWQHGECWAADERAVEIATGYEESWIRDAITQAGFLLDHDLVRGWWPGRPRVDFPNYQDYAILRRPD